MSLTIYIIRHHYNVLCKCDGIKEIKFQIGGRHPKGELLSLLDCGVISEYFFDKTISLSCKKCGEQYQLSNEHFTPAKEQYSKINQIK